MDGSTNWRFVWRSLVALSVLLGIGTGLLAIRPGLCDNFKIACNSSRIEAAAPAATAVAASDRDALCIRLESEHGLACSSVDFFTAARAGNEDAMALFVRAGLDAATSVTADGYGTPSGPAWQYLAKENPRSLRFLVEQMANVPGSLDKLRGTVRNATFNTCAAGQDPEYRELAKSVDCASFYIALDSFSSGRDVYCLVEEFGLDQTGFEEKLEALVKTSIEREYRRATNRSECSKSCAGGESHPLWATDLHRLSNFYCDEGVVHYDHYDDTDVFAFPVRRSEPLPQYCAALIERFRAKYPTPADFDGMRTPARDAVAALDNIRENRKYCR